MSCFFPRPARCIAVRCVAAAAALACLAPPLHAADRFWIDPLGDQFGTSSNWSATAGGAGGATIPSVNDEAFFTLNNTYTITFGGGVTNQVLHVLNGNVTFDLNARTYTLTAPSESHSMSAQSPGRRAG
jgi:hypothetical protein